MDAIAISGIHAIINSLTLPTQPPEGYATPLIEPIEGHKSAFINKSSLVTFVAGVSAQHQYDVLNSCLLAQLAADSRYHRELQIERWYRYYNQVLCATGWIMNDFCFTGFTAAHNTYSLEEVVTQELEAIASEEEMTVLKDTFAALKCMEDKDKRFALFEHSSFSKHNGSVQVSVSSEINGIVVTKMGEFYFDSKQQITNLAWFGFREFDTEMYKAAQSVCLNETVYEQYRDAISKKFANKIGDYLCDIEIGRRPSKNEAVFNEII